MKLPELLMTCFLAYISVGCSTLTKPLYYLVEIDNKGMEMIEVDRFQITAGRHSSMVSVVELLPGNGSSMGMFYNRPFESVTIQWRLSQKSETFQCEVPIHLPDEFTKERGHSIVFTIFPEHKKVDVSYEILDLKTEHMSIVPQQIPEKTH